MKSKKSIKSILIMAILGIFSLFFINMSFAANTAKINVEVANLREEANENSKVLEQLSLNEKVDIIEKNGNWYKIKVRGITGFVRQDLITLNDEQTGDTSENNIFNSQNDSEANKNENTVNEQTVETSSNSLNVKDDNEIKLGKQKISEDTKLKIVPAINATDITEVKKGDEVEVTEIINGWVCIETQTAKGWIRKEKIQKEDNQNETQNQEDVKNEQQDENTENKEEQQTEEDSQSNNQKSNTVIKTLYINSSAVNMRKEASTQSEVLKTLTLNTSVDVYEEANGWSRVKVDGKEGYISSSLLSATQRETSRSAEAPRTTTPTEEIDNDEPSNVSETNNSEEQQVEETNSSTVESSSGSSVVDTAMSFIGSKYVYGGASPSGFDCSGFTSYIYKQYGVNLNRTATGQYQNGVAVDRDNLQAGDLIIFGKSESSISHVGIYMGDGMIVHAANPSRGVTTDTIESGYYDRNYVGARRVM